jgi:hypothetical protein
VVLLSIKFVDDAFGQLLTFFVPRTWITLSVNMNASFQIASFLQMLIRYGKSVDAPQNGHDNFLVWVAIIGHSLQPHSKSLAAIFFKKLFMQLYPLESGV